MISTLLDLSDDSEAAEAEEVELRWTDRRRGLLSPRSRISGGVMEETWQAREREEEEEGSDPVGGLTGP